MSECEYINVDYTIDFIAYNSDKIKTKLYKSVKEVEYKILNYDDKVICDNDKKNGVYRSIVGSYPENKLLCFSPPKSMTLEVFKQENPLLDSPDIFVNEIVEGTMINLFYDPRIESWEIASKGAIGGNYWFYRTQYSVFNSNAKQPTFREMFLDAFRVPPGQDVNDFVGFEDFPKDYCYNFVLQHPANHIVLNIESPVLYLVSVYHIREDKVVMIPPTIYEEWDCFLGIRGLLEFPKHFDEETSYDDLTNKYCSANSPYHSVGLMITNLHTGDRTCMENPTYKEVRELRGNNPNLQYQYLCLRRTGKVMDFLKYFPKYKAIFYRFYKQYEEFVSNVHQSYISYYVKKNGIKISKKYFPIIYTLHHEVYLPSISTEN